MAKTGIKIVPAVICLGAVYKFFDKDLIVKINTRSFIMLTYSSSNFLFLVVYASIRPSWLCEGQNGF